MRGGEAVVEGFAGGSLCGVGCWEVRGGECGGDAGGGGVGGGAAVERHGGDLCVVRSL